MLEVIVDFSGGTVGAFTAGEQIVRCRDCKRFSVDQSDHDYRSGWLCDRWHTDMVEPNGFCAWGEQRKETGCSEAS